MSFFFFFTEMCGVTGILSDSFLELLACTLAGSQQFPFYISNILAPSNFRKNRGVEQYFTCTYSSLLVQEDNFLISCVFLCYPTWERVFYLIYHLSCLFCTLKLSLWLKYTSIEKFLAFKNVVSAHKIPDGKKLRKLVKFLEMLFYLLGKLQCFR